MLAHMLMNELELARFVWKRLPEQLRGDPELRALWEIGKQMWLHEPAAVQAALVAHAWSSALIETLVKTLQRRSLEGAFRHFGSAYSTIMPETLSAKLGVSVTTVHELALAHGWVLEMTSGAYKPVPTEMPLGDTSQKDTMQQLTDFVAHLEREVR